MPLFMGCVEVTGISRQLEIDTQGHSSRPAWLQCLPVDPITYHFKLGPEPTIFQELGLQVGFRGWA